MYTHSIHKMNFAVNSIDPIGFKAVFFYIFFSFTSNCDTEPIETVSKQTAGLTNPFFYIEPTTKGLITWLGVAPSLSVLPEAPDFLRIRIKPIECFAGTGTCRSTTLHDHVCAIYYDFRL